MNLYVVRHSHQPERCPAQNPNVGAKLLNHLSRPNVRQHGVAIKGEAVVHGEHTLYLIVEAPDEPSVHRFMAPFRQAGAVDIFPASTCARVVTSGGCGAAEPETGSGASLDPEEACQQAIEAGLVVHRAHPLNGETSLQALIGGVVMPNARFYVRNHFHMPVLDGETFALNVGGLVERPLRLSMRDLRDLPSQTAVVTLECAGNGRTMFVPHVEGEQWRHGAVSTAEWTGVPLSELLDRAGAQKTAREVVFRGDDEGSVAGRERRISFERSLRLDEARDAGALLAYAMNGEPLSIQHGYPLRLIVPGWYAVASVKWLTTIEVIDGPFDGYYQAEKYWFETEQNGRTEREPVTLQRVRSLITEPMPDQHVRPGMLTVRGVAWSGAAPIARVDVRLDDGAWHEARLVGDRRRHSWQWWECTVRVDQGGPATLSARATDLAGRTQPERAEWNRHGYGNNSIQQVPFTIRRS